MTSKERQLINNAIKTETAFEEANSNATATVQCIKKE